MKCSKQFFAPLKNPVIIGSILGCSMVLSTILTFIERPCHNKKSSQTITEIITNQNIISTNDDYSNFIIIIGGSQ